MRWVGELARRKVLKVGAVYLATAWVLLQLTDIVAPALELPAWTLKFVLLLLVLGFPVAVMLAWQFNLTDRGLQPEATGAERPARTRKRDWALLGVMAVLGIGVGVAAQRMLTSFGASPSPSAATAPAPRKAPAAHDASVAVLPFVNMGGVAEDGYFADGLSEEILNSLANVAGLKVAGRTSSFSYKGRDQDIRKIGRELGVGHVIEGSVRRQGDKLRVTAQLIKADDGFHLWSQTFDRTLDDTLAIQSEIAAAVADKLKLSVLPASTAATRLDAASQQAYLQALGLVGDGSDTSMERAVALLRPLQKAHPDFIPAYLPLADSVQRLGWYGRIPWKAAFAEMQSLSEEASRRAPRDLDVRVLAALIPFAANDWAPTYAGYERVLATHRRLADEAPSHPLLQLNTADAARLLSQYELALRYADRFIALEPRDPKGPWTLAMITTAMGREQETMDALRRSLAVSPRFVPAYYDMVQHQARTGRFSEALDTVQACQRAGPETCTGALVDMYRFLRQDRLADEASNRSGQPLQLKYRAFSAARRQGGYRAAMRWLQQQGAEAESLKLYFSNDLASAALESGEDEALLELQRALAPGVFVQDAPLLYAQLDEAAEVCVALHRLGRPQEARPCFQRVLATARREQAGLTRPAQVPEAVALAWLGDHDAAMAVLRREVGRGWMFERYLTETMSGKPDPLVEPLRDRADFQQLMREVRKRNAARFAELKASGRPLLPDARPAAPAIASR